MPIYAVFFGDTDPENVRSACSDPLRSLKIIKTEPSDSMSSAYWCSTVTSALFCIISKVKWDIV